MAFPIPSDQKQLQAFADRRHPLYEEMLDQWKFCASTYEGGREWFANHVHRYFKEGPKEYEDRVRRAYRFNHSREVVNLITKYIFKEGVERNTADAPQAVQDFWQSATLAGEPVEVFMRIVADKSSIMGRAWLVVDNNMPVTAAPITKGDEKNIKQVIYAYLLKQTDVLDFSINEDDGKLNWITYRLHYRNDSNPFDVGAQTNPRFMLWTRESWAIFDDVTSNTASIPVVADVLGVPMIASVPTGQMSVTPNDAKTRHIRLVEQGENSLGEIPVFPVDHIDSEKVYNPPGMLDEIAYLDRTVANYLSNLDAIIQDQTFSQLVIPSQGVEPGDSEHNSLVEMSTKRVFTYNGEALRGPEFISPDASQAAVILNAIKMIIGEIYHSVGMAGERTKQDNAAGIDNSSGVAKAYDFDRLNSLLCSKASQLQRAEERLVYFVCKWAGVAVPADPVLTYPKTYDIRGLPDEFDIAQNLSVLSAPDTIQQQQMTVIANKLFPQASKAIKDKILADIKKWPPDPIQMAQEMMKVTGQGGDASGTITKQSQPGGGQQQGSGAPPDKGSAPLAGPKPVGKSKQGQNSGDKS